MRTEIADLLAEARGAAAMLIATAALDGAAALYIFSHLLIGGGHVTVSGPGWTVIAGGLAFVVAALLALAGLSRRVGWDPVNGDFSAGALMWLLGVRRRWLACALFFTGAGLASIPAAVVQVIS